MKSAAIAFIALVVFSSTVEARGSHRLSGAYRAPKASAYHPPKLYSCPACNTSDHYVAPTIRSNGQLVQGHMQSDSNSTRADNFSHKGNINPYTGEPGHQH